MGERSFKEGFANKVELTKALSLGNVKITWINKIPINMSLAYMAKKLIPWA